MKSHLEDSIEENLRTHGYDYRGTLETMERHIETLQMALARVTTLLVEKNLISLEEFKGPEHPEEQHFSRVRRQDA